MRIQTLGVMLLVAGAWGQELPSGPSMKTAPRMAVSRVDRIFARADEFVARQADRWFDQGDFPRAAQACRLRSFMYPADYDAATDYGWLLESMNQFDSARDAYRRFRLGNPLMPDRALAEAQFCFLRLKDYKSVVELLEPVLSEKPHPNNYRILARSYEKLENLKDSLRVYEKLIKDFPGDAAAKLNAERIRKKLQPTS
ncbi:MAG: tetratricopeptide repeat protein [Chthonomonas sp.]|nr:tetratricopeptide repeat protein [Chthonomonas sp.]